MFSLFASAIVTCSSELGFPLPFKARISSPFGMRSDPFGRGRRMHHGIDFVAASGTPVIAAMQGKAIVAGDYGGYGLTVILESSDHQERTLYAHLSKVLIAKGAIANVRSTIGRVGSTGRSTGPHLHFEQQEYVGNRWIAIEPVFANSECSED